MKTTQLSLLLMVIILIGCSEKNPLEVALSSENSKIKQVMDSIAKYEVQVLYTEVLEKEEQVIFKDYSFQVNDSNYFYPASSVKFPVAVLALEKLGRNQKIDRNTLFSVGNDSLKTSFAEEIKKIFAVSDNKAFTRLFEYLGQDYITNSLQERGIISRISHRFSSPNPYSLTTEPLHFYKNDSLIFSSKISINDSLKPLNLNKISKGVGYIYGDNLVNEPKDFGLKNQISITSLHNLMKQIIYPESFPKEKRFNISKEDRTFLLNMMKILPKEANYTTDEYYDSYGKFFVFGDSKKNIPNHIKIYNKVGYAYGYLTDCSYIVDEKANKKYFITATIHVNHNQIFNDGVYEYDEVGIPFLAELGRQLIDYQLPL